MLKANFQGCMLFLFILFYFILFYFIILLADRVLVTGSDCRNKVRGLEGRGRETFGACRQCRTTGIGDVLLRGKGQGTTRDRKHEVQG